MRAAVPSERRPAAAEPGRGELHVTVLDRQRSRAIGAGGLKTFLRRAARWVPADTRGTLNVCLVSDPGMRVFNRKFRGEDCSTDVLSFPGIGPGGPGEPPHLGDIVISVTAAVRQARERDHSVAREVKLLALHGMLHVLGYDHGTDGGTMMRLQRKLERRLLPERRPG